MDSVRRYPGKPTPVTLSLFFATEPSARHAPIRGALAQNLACECIEVITPDTLYLPNGRLELSP